MQLLHLVVADHIPLKAVDQKPAFECVGGRVCVCGTSVSACMQASKIRISHHRLVRTLKLLIACLQGFNEHNSSCCGSTHLCVRTAEKCSLM